MSMPRASIPARCRKRPLKPPDNRRNNRQKAAPGAPLFYWASVMRRRTIAVTRAAPDIPVIAIEPSVPIEIGTEGSISLF
jgi:hypothetical protein